ncbi:MAG: nucleoside triphosphate pyrophosphohydrolase, partial [Planctomycetota bacterium]
MGDDLIHDTDAGIDRLLHIMRRLRDPQTGCPWDIEQSFATIAPYTIEEAYEVADAIERQDWPELEGELGDLLLQTVYHTAMGEEAGHFSFQSVVTAISDKMVARHPHVFGDANRDKSAAQQTRDWEAIKAAERSQKAQAGALDGVAMNLPALLRAVKLQKRAARVGFDWPETTQVLAKLTEEAAELVEARTTLSQDEVVEEMGEEAGPHSPSEDDLVDDRFVHGSHRPRQRWELASLSPRSHPGEIRPTRGSVARSVWPWRRMAG